MLEHESKEIIDWDNSKEPFSISDVEEAIDSANQKMRDYVQGKDRFVSCYEAINQFYEAIGMDSFLDRDPIILMEIKGEKGLIDSREYGYIAIDGKLAFVKREEHISYTYEKIEDLKET